MSGMQRAAVLGLLWLGALAHGQEPVAGVYHYPRTVALETGIVTLYPPQVTAWDNFEDMAGLLAIQFQPTGSITPVYASAEFSGSATLTGGTDVVHVSDVMLTSLRAADGGELAAEHDQAIREALPLGTREVPLNLVVSYLEKGVIPEDTPGIKLDPPEIIVTTDDARLLLIQGEPSLVPVVPEQTLQFVTNTNWPLFFDGDAWYLLDNQSWHTARELSGDWRWAGELPGNLRSLPDDGNWEHTREAAQTWDGKPDGDAPRIYVREKPTELIDIDGPPQLEEVTGAGLSYVTNTEMVLFHYDDAWFYLVSGRWFSAGNLEGEWRAVSDLPEAFADIPHDHAASAVLASVPGTPEATMAAIKAQVPSRTEMPKDVQVPVTVTYAGDPQFEQVEGVEGLTWATNTEFDVLQHGVQYYLCYSGDWYVSDSATGPWQPSGRTLSCFRS